MELSTKEESCEALKRLEDFLAVGNSLKLDSLRFNKGADLKTLVLMITTDTSALLQQVIPERSKIKLAAAIFIAVCCRLAQE